MHRELGLGLLSDGTRGEFEEIARAAEAAGIDVLSVYHDLLHPPALGPLLAMARVTERIRLGPAALNPFTLHPYEIAGQVAALDAESRAAARTSASPRAHGSSRWASRKRVRSQRSGRRWRSCAS